MAMKRTCSVDRLNTFLKKARTPIDAGRRRHIVMGNESEDLYSVGNCSNSISIALVVRLYRKRRR